MRTMYNIDKPPTATARFFFKFKCSQRLFGFKKFLNAFGILLMNSFTLVAHIAVCF